MRRGGGRGRRRVRPLGQMPVWSTTQDVTPLEQLTQLESLKLVFSDEQEHAWPGSKPCFLLLGLSEVTQVRRILARILVAQAPGKCRGSVAAQRAVDGASGMMVCGRRVSGCTNWCWTACTWPSARRPHAGPRSPAWRWASSAGASPACSTTWRLTQHPSSSTSPSGPSSERRDARALAPALKPS